MHLKLISFQMEIKRFHAEKQITMHGKDIPNPIFSFDEGNFPGKLILVALFQYCKLFLKLKKRHQHPKMKWEY